MAVKVLVYSLGCPKNQVDLGIMLKKLEAANFLLVEDFQGADIAIVNTCAFIEDAKKESIESILEAADYKSHGIIKKIIVTGCLAERYRDEIFKEIPLVDAVLGIGANEDIVAACHAVMENTKVKSFPPKEKLPLDGSRTLTTPRHYA
ncbi:MAG TPA: 30S ribosomal protein S12 methylthiotransferase RimO, partial [Clostridiales bacterium]|nr:30S ribosomal protein S12 methylthiotransferase RimO [Clostridiales bacterium]